MHFRRSHAVVATLCACLGIASAASAELTAVMRIKAQKQGDIKGGITQKGRENGIAVVAFDHTLISPTDASTGMATGKRQHKPFTITKVLDKSTPALRNAWAQNEMLTTVVIQLWQPHAATGAEMNYLTITLNNARIVGIHETSQDNRVPENTRLAASEDVTFVYDSITWTWTDGGLTASDTAHEK